ncbi:hypothetical protein DBT_0410 [Dissulfuribacter thermophilus]|uniref:Uncharacterized protein n=1 Tax=Dissulfuribacter thermophilus TaxID=1156395 RepID=A0A1B9F7L6_9BACT|nr:hypothetical protein DBT_0410 [Dissulfuribacter thermophilus]
MSSSPRRRKYSSYGKTANKGTPSLRIIWTSGICALISFFNLLYQDNFQRISKKHTPMANAQPEKICGLHLFHIGNIRKIFEFSNSIINSISDANILDFTKLPQCLWRPFNPLHIYILTYNISFSMFEHIFVVNK